MYYCYRFDNKGKAWYVAQLPGEGGKDWGYDNKENAKQLTDYWSKRFISYQSKLGLTGYRISV